MSTSDRRSPEAAKYRVWYKGSPWLRARAAQLAEQPLCERCLAMKPQRIAEATVVNHREPHRGDWALFIDPANHESTCKPHHDGTIQQQERTGYSADVDPDGQPTDPLHPWNRD